MPESLSQLRLAAVNIDGVLLTDTFSPVIHHFVVSRGGEYTVEVERQVFSQPQQVASEYLARATPVPMTGPEALAAYFAERELHLREHPLRLMDGAVELVRRLRGLGLATVCYGGLGKQHFDRYLGEWADLFDGPGYVCTNDFRPGITEISAEVFGLAHDQVVFIDDVARVAESAKALDVPFIGHPSSFEHSYQRELMRQAGVRHLADSLDAIDEAMVRRVDAEAAAGAIWSRAPESLPLA